MLRIRPQPATRSWSRGRPVPRFAATGPFARRQLSIPARSLPLAGFAMPHRLAQPSYLSDPLHPDSSSRRPRRDSMHVCKSTTIPETRSRAVLHNGFLDNRRGCPHLVSYFDRLRRDARLKMLPVMSMCCGAMFGHWPVARPRPTAGYGRFRYAMMEVSADKKMSMTT